MMKNKSNEKFVVYTENQTIPVADELFEIANWSTGYKITNVKELAVNNFDGMSLVSKEFGQKLQKYLMQDEKKHSITGYQLRLPEVKGFFPVVDIRDYFKEKEIEVIYHIFGQPHKTNSLDILACESTFKAKLDTSSGKKQWMWNSIQEYKDVLVKHKYDCIGVANYAHKVNKNEYRNIIFLKYSEKVVVFRI